MSVPIQKVCLVGANGSLGSVILDALVVAGTFEVSVMMRANSTSELAHAHASLIPGRLPSPTMLQGLQGPRPRPHPRPASSFSSPALGPASEPALRTLLPLEPFSHTTSHALPPPTYLACYTHHTHTHTQRNATHAHTLTHLTPGPRCMDVDVWWMWMWMTQPTRALRLSRASSPRCQCRATEYIVLPFFYLVCPSPPLALSHHAIPSLQEDLPPSPNSSHEGRVPVLREPFLSHLSYPSRFLQSHPPISASLLIKPLYPPNISLSISSSLEPSPPFSAKVLLYSDLLLTFQEPLLVPSCTLASFFKPQPPPRHFAIMGPFAQNNWAGWPYAPVSDPFAAANVYSHISNNNNYPSYLAESMDAYQAHHQRMLNQQMPRTTESKPRLSKEEVEILEAEFQKNHKPNSTTKKALAESMRVDNARINNWFQNRRAREKKEKNIREYEAKQRQEKEKAVASGIIMGGDRKRDLVASSAPFPGSEPASLIRDGSDSPASSVDEAALDMIKSDDVAPSMETTPDLIGEATAFAKHHASTNDDTDGKSPEDMHDYLSISDASADGISMSDNELYMPLANRSPSQLLGPEFQSMTAGPAKASQFFSSSMFLGGDLSTDQSSFGLIDRDASISPTSQVPAGMHLKSPPSIDIATRRNRRPTPLSINAAHIGNSGSGVPKTAIDLSKMAETAKFMRRTSSTSSSGRISKPTTTPRNMFTMNRSPSSTGAASSMAPPTPDTPIVASSQGINDLSLSGTFSLDTKIAGFATHDPTLSTPPSTPGIMENVFNMNSAYGMGISEDYLVNTGLGGLPSSFDMTTMTVPGYVNGAAMSSQQANGVYNHNQQNSSPSFMGFYANNDWSSS
ncbi:hypothetical protein NLG97_g3283 [Lecanicillium saksenae]|uniref:Uncharacterized protein n=1 Tax=Lecanicillium saksenae TaxID=468837 RepID=A0ACC1R1T6_9HYPO|nr:hypothetical protein NLG97_g3283 [Lecanicillium saksenae]